MQDLSCEEEKKLSKFASMQTNASKTPMMRQWSELKNQAQEALLLFRLGDFYEAFFEDAEIVAREIDLTLTKRQDIPMCGVPYHALQSYVDKLLAKGHKIAIAEQMEMPSQTKGIVKRQIVRVLTPGALTSSSLLQEGVNNFVCSLYQVGKVYGLCFIDVSTSTCTVIDVERDSDFFDLCYKHQPSELLLSDKFYQNNQESIRHLQSQFGLLVTTKPARFFEPAFGWQQIESQFDPSILDSFALKESVSIYALEGLLRYLKEEIKCDLSHLKNLKKELPSAYMSVDAATLSNLEIFQTSKGKENSLASFLDKTKTPMGSRLLKEWLRFPLRSIEEIEKRQQAVSFFINHPHIMLSLKKHLQSIKDLERIMNRLFSSNAHARDFVALRYSLEPLIPIKALLQETKNSLIQQQYENLCDPEPICSWLEKAFVDQPSLKLGEGQTFKEGFDHKLDELTKIKEESKNWLNAYQEKIKQELGIKTLKVSYTKAFGYYIEVSKAQAGKMPSSFTRKQTLVNAERFLSEELKLFEHKILHADEERKGLEEKLFAEMQEKLQSFASIIFNSARAISVLDLILSLAQTAIAHDYVKPAMNDQNILQITQGRHPVIEQLSPEPFTPNDSDLSEQTLLYLITGPNMAGKSTYIRQVALIVFMAHIGSFVPAQKAVIGLTDQIFSRIGASDDLSQGQSTFMVEMTQTAHILNCATDNSLVILDEIGRGTSTYDGIAIAYAVANYLLNDIKAKTLFATHYSELTAIAEDEKKVKNMQVAVEETKETILFLHKIIPGIAAKSYGIHVAKLAGLPKKVIAQAAQKLFQMEDEGPQAPQASTMPLFDPSPAEIEELKECDPNQITPIQALQMLVNLKKKYAS
jgi:DNA mismatch repair protein MutS